MEALKKMKRVMTNLMEKLLRTFKTDTYPYQPELSHHAVVVAVLSCIFFILFDIMHTLNDDNSIVMWTVHICLFGAFFIFLQPWVRFFSQPLIGKPSYSNFNKWYVSWLLVAAVYHLPSSQSMGVYMRMNLSLFLTTFASSILCLLVFHSIFDGLRYFFSREARKWPDMWTVGRLSVVVSIACCVFLSHCRETPLEPRNLKDQLCSSWLRPVESASIYYYPLFYMWDNYGRTFVIYQVSLLAMTHNSPRKLWVWRPMALYGRRTFSWSGSATSSSDEIYLVYSSWTTLVGLYIANYIAERSFESGGEEYEKKEKHKKPDFLDMVPWYSGTSADLYKTVFDLLVSVNIFLGRFDMRILQAATNRFQDGAQQGDFLYDQFSKEEELWFDFIADTGDGGNSTYTVARLLAQPSILDLPRGKLLLIGGDLAYPNPSEFTYERRLFRPFEYALQPPIDQDEVPHDHVPKCFIIPGNHDWFDGLRTFMRNICHKNWLGGWSLPQKKSYFALKLPKGWWIFGLDLALDADIDRDQFQFFSNLARDPERVGKQDSVIIMTHQPDWLLDWYENRDSKNYVSDLIYNILKERCKLRIAGDIHHYMRHSSVPLDKPVDHSVPLDESVNHSVPLDEPVDHSVPLDEPVNHSVPLDESVDHSIPLDEPVNHSVPLDESVDDSVPLNELVDHSAPLNESVDHSQPVYPHLLVNGCGGAFAHPTHVFRDFGESHGVSYKYKFAYPSFEISRKLAFRNISNFRKENWQFDFIGGIIYFILVFSMFPQCKLDHIFEIDSLSGFLWSFSGTLWNAFIYMLEYSYVSLGGAILLLILAFAFVPSKVSWKTRVVIGILHVAAHLAAALILMLALEMGVETFVRHKLLATSGYDSLYQWYRSVFPQHFPVPSRILARIKQWTLGLYPAGIKYLMSAFDVPELMAVGRSNICKNGMEFMSRWGAIIYYASVFLYFWVLSTPAVSFVFGSYLYICINWFNLHYDEAFSSLRIADYKAFTRFHIQTNGDLEVFTLAVDEVPKEWEVDTQWESEQRDQPEVLSHPSKWIAAAAQQDPLRTVKIIDKFVIKQTEI